MKTFKKFFRVGKQCLLALCFLFCALPWVSAGFLGQNAAQDVHLPFDGVFLEGDREVLTYPRQKIRLHFVFKNTGELAWEAVGGANPVFLGLKENPYQIDFSANFQNWGWSNDRRIKMTENFYDHENQVAIFDCEIVAPAEPGVYRIPLQLIVEGDDYIGFFGEQVDFVLNVDRSHIEVSPPTSEEGVVAATMPPDELSRIDAAQKEANSWNERLATLEDHIVRFQEEIEKTKSIVEKQELLSQLAVAREEKEQIEKKIRYIDKKTEMDDKIFAANVQGMLLASSDGGGVTALSAERPLAISRTMMAIAVFFSSFFLIHRFLSRRFGKNDK